MPLGLRIPNHGTFPTVSAAGLIKRVFLNQWYESVATQFLGETSWTFMNYGVLDDDAPAIALQPEEEKDRNALRLYLRTLGKTNIEGMDVLEVGCGRGGGAAHLARVFRPRSMVALDFSKSVIRFCDSVHSVAGLSFVCGDAEAMPFADGMFDFVINVESSHCYASMPGFLGEAHRVLREGGALGMVDFRDRGEVATLRAGLPGAGFTIREEEDITSSVMASLTADSPLKERMISERVPEDLRLQFREFAATVGSTHFRAFQSGSVEYWRYLLTKDRAAEKDENGERAPPVETC